MIKIKVVTTVNPDFAASEIEKFVNDGYSLQRWDVTEGEYTKYVALLSKED